MQQKKSLEKYNSEKFEKIKMKVEESNKKEIQDKKMQQNFEKIIVQSALAIAQKLCANIEIESSNETGIIQFELKFWIIEDRMKQKIIELFKQSDSIQIFSTEKMIKIILKYNFKI